MGSTSANPRARLVEVLELADAEFTRRFGSGGRVFSELLGSGGRFAEGRSVWCFSSGRGAG